MSAPPSHWLKPPRAAQCCSTCSAWTPNKAKNPRAGTPRPGWCTALPPALIQVMIPGVGGPRPGVQGAWPTSNADGWCRQWEPMEDDDGTAAS